jgi:hypothetical protein
MSYQLTKSQINRFTADLNNFIDFSSNNNEVDGVDMITMNKYLKSNVESFIEEYSRPIKRSIKSKNPKMTDEEKAEKLERKNALKAQKSEKMALLKAKEKAEWKSAKRIKDIDGDNEAIKGLNGSFLRIEQNRNTGVFRKKNESNWTEKANKVFETHFSMISNTPKKPNMIEVLNSLKNDSTEETTEETTEVTTEETTEVTTEKTKDNSIDKDIENSKLEKLKAKEAKKANKAEKLALLKAKKAEKLAAEQAEKLATEQAEKLATEQAEKLAAEQAEKLAAEQAEKLAAEQEPEISTENITLEEDDYINSSSDDEAEEEEKLSDFTSEKFPGQNLKIDSEGVIYDDNSEMIGIFENGEVTTL